jgi:hypothetical protein
MSSQPQKSSNSKAGLHEMLLRLEDYGIGSASYLARAKSRLEQREPASLFYAALELRCCVEARQDEYLEAQKRYRRSLPRSWQIGKKARELDSIFAQDRISEVTFSRDGIPSITGFHIPIQRPLVKKAEGLGDYLHAKQKFHSAGDAWWSELEALLKEIYRGVWYCCRGILLCPPFLHEDGTTSVAFEYADPMPPHWERYREPGTQIVVKVEYPSGPPADWVCDIQ